MQKSLQRLAPITLLISLLLAVGCGRSVHNTEGEMRIAISQDVAGYAVVGGERYGFVSDVADTVARALGRRLQVCPNLCSDSIFCGLEKGEIDVAVVPRSERLRFHKFPSESFYTTDYVVLMPSWLVGTNGPKENILRGKRLLSDSHFRTHSTYRKIADSGAVCDTSELSCTEMARRVATGKAHAMICERSEAALACFLYRSLQEVATINEPCEVILLFANRAIKESFVTHLREFATTEEYAALVDLYFGETSIVERFKQLKYRPTRVIDGISVWDSQLKNISQQMGVDWRLMSAMAYHESRFRNDQVSHKGAVGLMQVTPIVVEDFGLEEGYDLADPSNNISLAARLLRRSSRALGFGDFPTTDDGIAILVASYNCGITRTLEAQRLVVAEGGDGASWEAIRQMMTNMSNPEWIATSDYRMRRFGDAPVTIAYTEGVMSLYDSYRETLQ